MPTPPTWHIMDMRSRLSLDSSWKASAKLNCLLRIISRYYPPLELRICEIFYQVGVLVHVVRS